MQILLSPKDRLKYYVIAQNEQELLAMSIQSYAASFLVRFALVTGDYRQDFKAFTPRSKLREFLIGEQTPDEPKPEMKPVQAINLNKLEIKLTKRWPGAHMVEGFMRSPEAEGFYAWVIQAVLDEGWTPLWDMNQMAALFFQTQDPEWDPKWPLPLVAGERTDQFGQSLGPKVKPKAKPPADDGEFEDDEPDEDQQDGEQDDQS